MFALSFKQQVHCRASTQSPPVPPHLSCLFLSVYLSLTGISHISLSLHLTSRILFHLSLSLPVITLLFLHLFNFFSFLLTHGLHCSLAIFLSHFYAFALSLEIIIHRVRSVLFANTHTGQMQSKNTHKHYIQRVGWAICG